MISIREQARTLVQDLTRTIPHPLYTPSTPTPSPPPPPLLTYSATKESGQRGQAGQHSTATAQLSANPNQRLQKYNFQFSQISRCHHKPTFITYRWIGGNRNTEQSYTIAQNIGYIWKEKVGN